MADANYDFSARKLNELWSELYKAFPLNLKNLLLPKNPVAPVMKIDFFL